MTTRRQARESSSLRAVVRSRRPLFYAQGADRSLDRPAHVRAGSGLAWWTGGGLGARLVVAQDDSSFLALLDAPHASVDALTLDHVHEGQRQFDDTRGNKKRKLDLEACTVARGPDGRERMIAWGSGSLPARERLVVLEPGAGARIVDAGALYAGLRGAEELAGSELNIEGAAALGDRVRLFQRGNGAPRGALQPVDATCDLDLAELLAWLDAPESHAPPRPRDIVQWDLGSVRGVRLTFTDACRGPGDAVAFLAAAEASPDATRDGEVVGVAIGVLERSGEARWALVRDAGGEPVLDKCEGLAWVPGAAGRRALVVVDRDDPDAPSELLELDLEGFPAGA